MGAAARDILSPSRTAFVSLDGDGRVRWVNRSGERLLGAGQDDLVGRDIRGLVQMSDLSQAEAFLSVGQIDGEGSFVLRSIRAEDGRSVQLRWTVQASTDVDGAPGLLCALHDVRSEHFELLQVRSLLGALPVGSIDIDTGGRIVDATGPVSEILGRSQDQLTGRKALSLVHPDDAEMAIALSEAVRTGDELATRELRILRSDGSVIWLRCCARPRVGSAGLGDGMTAVFVDITSQRWHEDEHRDLFERSPLPHALLDAAGLVTDVNQGFAELLGWPRARLTDRHLTELATASDVGRLTAELDAVHGRSGAPKPIEVRFTRADGSSAWLQITLRIRDVGGTAGGILLAAEDITERRRRLARTNRMAAIVDGTSDIVALVLPRSGRVEYVNPAGAEALRAPDEHQVSVLDMLSPASRGIWTDEVMDALRSSGRWSGELDMLGAGGGTLTVWQTVSTDVDAAGRLGVISLVGRDVTQRRRMEEELEWRASHDRVTGLVNRQKFIDCAADMIDAGTQPAMVVLDIDRFARINERLGVDLGDQLLVELARRLTTAMNGHHVIGRVGGDDFGILCSRSCDLEDALALARRVVEAVEAAPFELDGALVAVTASVGVAVSSGRTTHAEQLLREADIAMYRAKRDGGGRLEVFRSDLHSDRVERRRLATDLADAIDQSLVVPYYQPIIELATGRLVGAEALARWQHPVQGLLSPDRFIALAEETGSIVALGSAIMRSVCRHVARWPVDKVDHEFVMHVNLSARQLANRDLASSVIDLVESAGIDPGIICLEITESLLMEDSEAVAATMTQLRNAGIRLAIDDFGTGYSSLAYLRRLPVDMLKIDRTFVTDLGHDPTERVIVRSIVGLASSLGLTTVAEGVETREQADALTEMGCDLAQGFLFAPAVPSDRFGELVDIAASSQVTAADMERAARPMQRALPPAPVSSSAAFERFRPAPSTELAWPDLDDDDDDDDDDALGWGVGVDEVGEPELVGLGSGLVDFDPLDDEDRPA